ncbi:MAG: hypothetical protein K6G33_01125 [Ruminococcus sp.]|uniref:DUF6572 domain-containing protein n=1 Tax=Ruminococcus sp. TaxID=41978 RepID=UPI0025D14917|nr:DUF6572 domain-containing protein [Ruminococcus sp.]MCR5599335.1 hypothetical protein [Ruminococcus sp.]
MSVVDRNVIDLVFSEEDYEVLCISDHIPWNDDVIKGHWEILQDKLKDYMGFIQSGQFKEKYGELKPAILIFFSHMYPDVVEKFLNKLKEVYCDFGCDLRWKYDPRE